MLVGDEYGVYLTGPQASYFQTRQEVLEPKTAVNQKPHWVFAARLNDRRISCTTAAKALESQHQRLPGRRPAGQALCTPQLLQVINDDFDNALGVGRWLSDALRIQDGHRSVFSLAFHYDAVLQWRNGGGAATEQFG